MANYRIVYAGCNEEIIKKLYVVSDLFKARDASLSVKFESWDGTKADLVVSNIDDSYGLKVARLALQRGMELFILARSPSTVPADLKNTAKHAFLIDNAPIALIFKQFSAYLESIVNKIKIRSEDTTLLLLKNLLNKNNKVFISYNSKSICHHIDNGMCLAENKETLEYIQSAILTKQQVSIQDVAPPNFTPKYSISAEDFFFHALLDVINIPTLPGNLIKLSCWPNINSKNDPNEIITLSALINSKFMSINSFLDIQPNISKAYLSAIALARLLVYQDTYTPDTKNESLKTKEAPSIIKKLSLWLGLPSKE